MPPASKESVSAQEEIDIAIAMSWFSSLYDCEEVTWRLVLCSAPESPVSEVARLTPDISQSTVPGQTNVINLMAQLRFLLRECGWVIMTGGWLLLTLFSTLGRVPAPGCLRPPDIDTCHCHQHREHRGRIRECLETRGCPGSETRQTEKIRDQRGGEPGLWLL